MEFRQLDAYINVYELKSFSRAAEEMFLSQPSISAYITSLEKELNTQLICRSTKEFIPTKSGVLFYEYAKEMLLLRDKSISSVKNSSDSNIGSIDILASSVPAQYILPKMLGDYHKLHPDIVYNLEQTDSMEVVKGIASYKSEIGFVGAKIENPKCVFKEFMSERLIMIAPYEERFRNINPDDALRLVYNEYFVMREAGSGTRLRYEKFLRHMGIKPDKLKVSAQMSNTQSIIHAVASGLGLAIVSELAAQQYIQKKMIIPVDVGFIPERKFYVVLKKNCTQTRIVDTFLKFVFSYTH